MANKNNKTNKSYMANKPNRTYKSYKTYMAYIVLFVLLLALVPFSPRITSAATLTRPPNNLGLVGYWPFDEGVGAQAGDASGNGNNGTINGATWADGKHGKAISFSNTGYVSLGNVNAYKVPTKTISFWAKPTTTETYDMILSNGSGNYYVTFKEGNSLFVSYIDSGGIQRASTVASGIVSVNEWAHYAVVFEVSEPNVTVSTYKNGKFENSVSRTDGYWPSYGSSFLIGAFTTSTYSFQGSLDEVRVYNRALSPTEIAALYRSGQVTRKVVSNQGLVGYWSMNEGVGGQVGDSSGNGNTGTINGATWADGKKGKALSFNGGGSYVNLGNSSLFDFTDNFTVNVWFKATSYGNYGGLVSHLRNSPFNGGWGLVQNINKLSFIRFNGTSFDFLDVDENPNVGEWHMLTGLVSAGVSYIYLDGIQQSNTSSAPISGNLENIAVIGRFYGNVNNYYFNGSIDDVRVYNRALSADEIAALYRQNETQINSSQNDKLTSGLVGMYSFNGPDVDSIYAYDRSGQGRNATLYNSPKPVIGKVGQALEFDGSSNYTSAAGFSELGTSNQSYTIAGWVWVADEETQGNVVHVSSGSNGTGWCLPPVRYLSSGVLSAYSWPTNSADGITILEKEVWYQFVTTWDSANGLRIFINGELENSSPQSTYSASGASNYVWTAFSPESCAGNVGDFKGRVDEVRIYNRALSADEVRQLYNMGN